MRELLNKVRNMYIYANGLRCAASKSRIKAFEMTIPLLLVGLLIAGLVIIPLEFFSRDDAIKSLVISLMLILAWSLFVGFVFSVIFKLWCKPLPFDQSKVVK